MSQAYYDTPIGTLGIAEAQGRITHVFFEGDPKAAATVTARTACTDEAARQLLAYFAGDLREFSVPLDLRGTPFYLAVWKALCSVPYGATATYKDMAVAAGNPKAARAVGLACNRNPVPLIVPCHRIVGAGGKLTGFGGGLDIKERLLNLERGHGLLLLRGN